MAPLHDHQQSLELTPHRGLVLRISPPASDDPPVITTFDEHLRPDFDIARVSTLRDALARIATEPVAAILVELDLPDSRGLATLRALIANDPRIPVIVLGHGLDDALWRSALALGAQDSLPERSPSVGTLVCAVNAAIVRLSAHTALLDAAARAVATLDSLGDGIVSTDSTDRIAYLNRVAEQLTGWTRDEAIGRPAHEVFRVIDAHTRLPARDALSLAARTNEIVGVSPDSILLRRDGTEVAIEDSIAPIHDRTGRVTGAAAVFRDVGASRTLACRMSHWAHHDFLTDLPNRLMFNDRVTQSVALARRHGKQFAILFLDIDHLKDVNDSFGHAEGDRVLKAVGARLVENVRASDTVCRQGGDEFVILLSEIEHASDAFLAAQKVRSALMRPWSVADQTLGITASIGISVFPRDGEDFETLMKSADAAMYQAKASGRNACCSADTLAPGRAPAHRTGPPGAHPVTVTATAGLPESIASEGRRPAQRDDVRMSRNPQVL